MPVILSTSNIIIDYGASNFTIETVKSYRYTDKDTVGTTSNISIEPYIESVSRMYPPKRYFESNNQTISSRYAVSIACGGSYTVVLTNDGKTSGFGDNSYGQLGSLSSLNISAIACGGHHTVFLTNEGKVYSCGLNNYGQLGLGITTNQSTPQPISTLNSFTISAIACGYGHTVFLTNNGKVYSCGDNSSGQLGRTVDAVNPAATPSQINVLDHVTISAIACGYNTSFFLTNYGKVYSCGNNGYGKLGRTVDTANPASTPLIISALSSLTISAVASGGNHTVFLTNDGKVYSCGLNNYGQLGLTTNSGTSTTNLTPTLITTNYSDSINPFNILTISAIACGDEFTIFLTKEGKVFSCGRKNYGQIGYRPHQQDAPTNDIPYPNPWPISSRLSHRPETDFSQLNISAIACGYSHTVCLNDGGSLFAGGLNYSGQLGISENIGTTAVNQFFRLISSYPLNNAFYGSGLYTVSYSSSTYSFEPFRCFNDSSNYDPTVSSTYWVSEFSFNKAATWAANNYTSSTGIYNKTLFLESGYNGDWLVLKLPVSIKLKRFDIKQISTALKRAPKNFRLYGSTNGSSWTLLVDKTNTVYENLFYTHTDMSQYPSASNQFYNHFGLVVNMILGPSETTLSFDELFIYGAEKLTPLLLNSTNKSLTIPITMLPSYPNSNMNYNLSFPVPTFINNISTSSNIILQGDYIVNPVSRTSTKIIPNGGQSNIPISSTLALPTTDNITLNYHLLNPLKDPKGVQWTYSSANTNVYHLGNVGIGTKTPSYPLHINGNMFVSSTAYTGSGNTSWTTISDRRIKDNIVKASYEKCFDNVKNIELYRFNFKDNAVKTNDTNQLGFIAQEVQNVYPKAVEVNKIKDKNGVIPDLLSLNTTQIDYTLYGAVKYLLEKIEKLEEKLNEDDNSNIIQDNSNIIQDNSNIIQDNSNIIQDN